MKKPKKVTLDGERKQLCDAVLEAAVEKMVKAGAPAEMIIDRLLTYAGAQICLRQGSPGAAGIFRELAANIDRGVFHSITGEAARH